MESDVVTYRRADGRELTVGAFETVKRRILEQAGWTAAPEPASAPAASTEFAAPQVDASGDAAPMDSAPVRRGRRARDARS